ncbi:MAG: F0F1 ATP synthase subunit delta [Labilithrix sp.]|nr:F0F1 ATP synthase subunit delta [Labilithrix sp.]MCW5830924.1 F0F1 ATP synthase subunit delta [Labilithrix sp.]
MGFSFTSFVFETINFVVLVWALQRLVYRPLKKSIDARRDEQEELRRSAEARLRDAEREVEELRRQKREIGELRERVMREAAEDAAATRARLLAEAKEDAAAARARGQKLLDSERQAAEARVRELAIEQSTHIAARLLAELSPRALDDALIDRLALAVRAHGVLAAGGGGRSSRGVELRFARRPAEHDLERLRSVFAEAFGAEATLATSEDATLVAGVVAKVGDHVLDASIAGNLALLSDRARELVKGADRDG